MDKNQISRNSEQEGIPHSPNTGNSTVHDTQPSAAAVGIRGLN